MESTTGRTTGADVVLGKPVRHRELSEALARLAGRGASLAAAPEVQRAEAIDFRGARVLLAEDNQVNQLIACDLLENLGCHVTSAEDGRAAIELWRTQSFDLVLMDCQMPDVDGFDATRAIRLAEAGKAARVPIVALTANAMETDRQSCLAAGMDDYLAKPFRSADLTAMLERWIGRAPATRTPDPAADHDSQRPSPSTSSSVEHGPGVAAMPAAPVEPH